MAHRQAAGTTATVEYHRQQRQVIMQFSRIVLAVCAALFTQTASAQERALKIGTEGAYPPFNSVNSEGTLIGLDIDIGNEICRRLEAKCEWIAADFVGLIPGLQNGLYDMVIASHSITPERTAVVDMVRYYSSDATMIFAKDKLRDDVSPAGMAGAAIGVQSGTTHAAVLDAQYGEATIRNYPTQVEAYADLASGRIDAVMGDKMALYDYVQTEDGKACCLLSEQAIKDPVLGDGIGIILVKNSPLRTEVEAALTAIRDDATYDMLTKVYFPFPIW